MTLHPLDPRTLRDKNKIPRVLLPMRLELSTGRFYLGREYGEAVKHFGGAPMYLGLIPEAEYVRAALECVQGVLLPGSDTDVDPSRFGQEPVPEFRCNIPEKDETDLLVIREAETLGLPIFAICYGMQILNVSRGGTLVQDIGKIIPGAFKHDQGLPHERLSHGIGIEDGSRLARIAGTGRARVNSHHHQSVDVPGEGLVASAHAGDSVVEAIEDPSEDRFVVGVQWHPELCWRESEVSAAVFREFINECSKYLKESH